MLARSTVPLLAGLMMSIVPLSAPMRSRRPFSPLVSDRGWAPPIPSSRTSTAHEVPSGSTRTQANIARACLTTLVSASERTSRCSPRRCGEPPVAHLDLDRDREIPPRSVRPYTSCSLTCHVYKAAIMALECHGYASSRAVSVLGHDQVRLPRPRRLLLISILTMQKNYYVRVLLY